MKTHFYIVAYRCLLDEVLARNQEIDFFPLVIFGDSIAFFYRSKSTLWRKGNLVTNYSLGFLKALLENSFVFKHWIFGGNKPCYKECIAVLHRCPRVKGTGAFIIVFYEVSVVRNLCNDWSYGVIEAMEKWIAFEVPFAEVSSNGHVFRTVFESLGGYTLEPIKHLWLGIA